MNPNVSSGWSSWRAPVYWPLSLLCESSTHQLLLVNHLGQSLNYFIFFSWNFCFLSFRATNYRHMELFDNFSKLVSDFSFFNIFFCVFMDYFLAMSSSFFIFSSAMSNLFLNHQYIFYFTCSFHHLIFNFVFFIFYNSVHIFEHMDCSHTYCVVIFLVSTFQYLCQLWISFNWLTFSLIMGCIFLHLWIYDTFGLYSRHCEFYIIVYWTYLFSYK